MLQTLAKTCVLAAPIAIQNWNGTELSSDNFVTSSVSPQLYPVAAMRIAVQKKLAAGREMAIVVQCPTDVEGVRVVTVGVDATVGDLMRQTFQESGNPGKSVDDYYATCGGRRLETGESLADEGVGAEAAVVICQKPPRLQEFLRPVLQGLVADGVLEEEPLLLPDDSRHMEWDDMEADVDDTVSTWGSARGDSRQYSAHVGVLRQANGVLAVVLSTGVLGLQTTHLLFAKKGPQRTFECRGQVLSPDTRRLLKVFLEKLFADVDAEYRPFSLDELLG